MPRRTQEQIVEHIEGMLPQEFIDLPEDFHDTLPDLDVKWKESPSSIVNYLGCPLRWWADRYSPMPSGVPNKFAVMGTIAHRILELFYNEPKELRTDDTLDRTRLAVWNSLTNGVVNGYVDEGMIDDFETSMDAEKNPDAARGWAFNRVKDFVDAIYDFDENPQEVDVVENERWVRTTVNGIKINGKIDRVDLVDGAEVVVDYKTGKAPEGKIDILSPTFIPVGIYAYLSTRPATSIVSAVELFYLKTGDLYRSRVRQDSLDATETLLDMVTKSMLEVVETKEIGVTPGKDQSSGPCTYCPLSQTSTCPIWFEDEDDEPFSKLRDYLAEFEEDDGDETDDFVEDGIEDESEDEEEEDD